MKTIEDYLKLPYKTEITHDADEGGYVISYPELPGCLTCADTLQAALENAEQAKKEWLLAAIESDMPIPKLTSD